MQKRGHLLVQLALNTSHADIVKNKNDCYNFDEEEESCQTDRTDKETKAANHSISSDNMAIPNFNFNNWEWEVNDRNVTKGSDYRRSKNFDLFNLEVENSKKVVKEGNGFINENQEIQVDFEEMQDSAMEPTENEIYNVNGLQKKIEILSTKLLDDNLKNKTKIVELAKKNRDGYTNNGFTNSEVGRNEVENEINFDNIYEKVGTSCEQRIQENEEVRDRSNSMDCEIEIDNLANNSFEDSSYCPETSNDSSSNSEIIPYSTNTIRISTQQINSQNFTVNEPLSNKLKKQKQSKLNRCKFCDKDVLSKNFTRHLQRSHSNEKEVVSVFQLPKNSKERRQAFSLLRNSANFDLYIKGVIRPYRERINKAVETEKFYPCVTCKGLFLKQYLRRHAKKCYGFKNTNCTKNYLGQSQTLSACAFDKTNVLSTLNVKEKVFDIMKGDQIALEAKKDILIAHYGESYLKKHKRDGIIYACSNRMRELSRLLISFRKVTNNNDVSFKDMLHPKHFDNVLFAARNIVGFDAEKKTFKSPSLAMHLGTSLKLVCEELVHLILKEKIGFRSSSVKHKKDWLENINYFKQLIKNRWNIELSSIANKDLNEKRWKKPLIVPLVSDVKKFRDQTLKLAQDYGRQIVQNEDNIKIFKLFVQSTLALLIIFNRRRIGDIQYLKIKDYLDEHKTNFKDFESVLTEGEKQLTRKYKRVLNSGKGSRAVVILIPEIIQSFINIIITYRNKYISTDNDYLFALPGSSIKWGKGDVALRTFSKMCNLENPQSITSNKLRKQIATVAQILNLSKEETKQFSKFMGHTEKTHEEFYELPVDIYQTAKVSKLLLMLEKGMPTKYKGKSLAEIDVDINQEYAEEEEEEEEEGKVEDEKKNEDNGNNDDEDRLVNVPKTITKKTLKKRKGWSKDNLSLLNKEFSKHIKNRTYPSTIEIRNFIKEYKINRTEAVVRSKIQHLLKQSI